MAEPDPDVSTVIGEVEGDEEIALGWAQLAVGKKRTARDRGGPLRLRLDDGAVVTIEISGGRGALFAPRPAPRKGAWSEVAGDPRAALVTDAAPGDHVHVELAGWVVPRGARLAVRGPARGAGARTIAARRIAVVDLDRGIAGDGAAIEALDRADRDEDERDAKEAARRDAAGRAAAAPKAARPRPRPVPVPWRIGAPFFLVLGAGLSLAAIATWRDVTEQLHREIPYAMGLATLGALALVIALAMWSSRPLYEVHDTGRARGKFHPTWAIGKAAGAVLAVQLVAGMIAIMIGGADRAPRWFAVAWLPVVLTAAGFTIWLAVRQRANLRFARLVLGADALPSPLPVGRWGRFEGTVVADGAVLERTVRYLQRATTRTVTARAQDGSTTTRQETTTWIEGHPGGSPLRAFAVAVGGQRVAIQDGDALWAAPAEFTAVDPADRTGLAFQTRASVRGGDAVVVLGRVALDDGRPVVHGGGAESLLIFAAPSAARATLRRAALVTVATIASLAAATIAGVAVLAHFWWLAPH